MFAFNEICYKDRQQTFFYVTYIQTYIQRFLSSSWEENTKLPRKIVIEHFVLLCLSPLQRTTESILGNPFSSVLKGHNFKFLLSLSAHQGATLGVTKYVTNNIPPNIPGYGTVIVIRQTGFFIPRSRICEFSSNKLVSTSPYELDSAGGSFWCFLTWTSAEVILFPGST